MKLKQRRLFFQANRQRNRAFVAGASKLTMRWLAATLTALLFLFTSCASLTPDKINLLAAIAGQAAQVGAQQWLVKHPDQRQLFNDVIAAIVVLVQQGITNQNAYIEQLNKLPTTTLAGPEGAVVIKPDHLVIRDTVANKDTILTEPATMPVLRSTVSGLRKGTAPQPPVPVVVVPLMKRRILPAGAPASTFRPAAPQSDDELNRQFEDYLKRQKR